MPVRQDKPAAQPRGLAEEAEDPRNLGNLRAAEIGDRIRSGFHDNMRTYIVTIANLRPAGKPVLGRRRAADPHRAGVFDRRGGRSCQRQRFATRACERWTNRQQPQKDQQCRQRQVDAGAQAWVSASLSIVFPVVRKRMAAIAIIAVPRIMSANAAMLPNFGSSSLRVRLAKNGAASARNRSNFGTRNPKAMAVRRSTAVRQIIVSRRSSRSRSWFASLHNEIV